MNFKVNYPFKDQITLVECSIIVTERTFVRTFCYLG